MSTFLATDRTVLDLLRRHERMTIADFERELEVTATAVRQRLNRLLASGYVDRQKSPAPSGRGRPSHWYVLTAAGQRKTGANFADLASVLWDEVRSISDPDVRRGLLQRISLRLADLYRSDVVRSTTVMDRMKAAAGIFGERQIPFDVQQTPGELPVLTALACPYPELAEKDRSICAMERMMLSELVGERLTLDQCRLDGDSCCTFQARPSGGDSDG